MANRYPVQPPQALGINPKRQHPVQQQQHQQPSAEQAQKRREYLKQQQKLRLMACATHKSQPVSTDTLIENLLGKKETFHPIDVPIPTVSSSNITTAATSSKGLQTHFQPLQVASVEWLSPSSPNFPPLYHQVWTMVGLPDGMVDTSKIYPLLLTSGLHTDVLGFIWGLSNRQVPGILTEQELYVLLALVALAQRGYSFNCASVLSLVPQPPLPVLNLGGDSQLSFGLEVNQKPQPPSSQPSTAQISAPLADILTAQFGNVTPSALLAQFLSTPFTQELPSVDQSEAKALSSEVSIDQSDFDDFTDFQSASVFTSSSLVLPDQAAGSNSDVSVLSESKHLKAESTGLPLTLSSKSSIPSRSSSSLPQDSKTSLASKFPTVAVVGGGRSIGSRLANHSLTMPKSSKTRHHKHHHHHHHRSVPPTVPSVSTDEEFSDFQQASSEEVSSKSPPTHTYLLKESAIRVNDGQQIPKIPEPTNKLQIVKEKKTATISQEIDFISQNSTPDFKDSEEDNSLMRVDEDRYSALRALSAIGDSPTEPADEYGDFFSIGAPTDDSFADIAARENPTTIASVAPWGTTEVAEPQNSVFEIDEWGAFMSLRDTVDQPNFSPVQENPNINSLSSNEEKPNFEVTDWGADSHVGDSLSTHLADLNLSSLSNITSVQLDKASLPPRSETGINQARTFFSLPDEISNPVSSILNISSESKSDNDDFGDFVSPAPWSEKDLNVGNGMVGNMWSDDGKEPDTQSVGKLWLDEPKGIDSNSWSDRGKYDQMKSTKDGVLDNPLVSNLWLDEPKGIDSNSWSDGGKCDQMKPIKDGVLDNPLVSNLWLEEGKGVDNQSVRSLELPGLDQAWDCVGEWRRCVQVCVSVLQFAVHTLDSISGPKVLLEVFTSSEGLDYLRGLAEVWAVCERLASSYRQSGSDHKLDALLNSAESMWVTLKPHFLQAQLPLESDVSTEGRECCGICLVSGAKLEFGGHNYHAACANLWVNLVDTSLPALHQP